MVKQVGGGAVAGIMDDWSEDDTTTASSIIQEAGKSVLELVKGDESVIRSVLS